MPSRKRARTRKKAAVKSKTSHPAAHQSSGTTSAPAQPANLVQPVKHDRGSLKPDDMLQLQRTIGNRAVNQRLAVAAQRKSKGKKRKSGEPSPTTNGKTPPAIEKTAPSTEVIQLARERTIVRGITHLVKMSGHTLLGGKEGKTLWDGDVVKIDNSDRIWSRRGIHAETQKAHYKDEGHDYKWFKALTVNDRDVSGDNFYIRSEMVEHLKKSRANPALESAQENETIREMLEKTIEMTEEAADLGQTARDLLRRQSRLLNQIPDDPRFNKGDALDKIDEARGQIRSNIITGANRVGSQAGAELSKPAQSQGRTGKLFSKAKEKVKEGLGALAAIEKQTVTHGRQLFFMAADSDQGLPLWSEVLAIGDEAHDERVGGAAETNELIAGVSSFAKETASSIWGYFNNLFDAFGIIAASVGALAAITAVSAIVAIVGVVLGVIAFFVGLIYGVETYFKEGELKGLRNKLEEGEISEELVGIADYAHKQKKKKRRRQFTVAAAGITVATLALIGLAGGPVGIAMAILAASIGVGFIVYKAWRKWRGKKKAMNELVSRARAGDQEKVDALKKLGISDGEINNLDDKATRSVVKDKVEQALKDKRVNTANQLVNYLRFGKPSEKLAAEKIVGGLGLDTQQAADPDQWSQEKAVSKVASKLSSW